MRPAARGIPIQVLLGTLAPLILAVSIPLRTGAQTGATSRIFAATEAGDVTRVMTLLEADPALLKARDGDGMTLLHHAVVGKHTELARLLLDRGADVSAADALGQTALHRAAHAGDSAMVALLLAHGADVEARENQGRTPLFMATNWGDNLTVVRQLIAAGADVNDRTNRGQGILAATLFYGKNEIVNALLAAGARLPDDDASVGQAMYLAASNGFESVFRMATEQLEKHRIRWWESIPMQAAARGGSVAIGEALREHGVPVDTKNLYGITPLHVAAENGRLAFAEFLVRNGASLETTSAMGMTAYHFAVENGHDRMAARLQALGAPSNPAVFPELRGPWLGQPEPGDSAEPFALGIVSDHGFDSEHSPAAFSPDGTEVYWTKKFRGPILYSRLKDGRWTAPRPASYMSSYGDGEPIFAPDGRRLYFLSMRPLEPGAAPGKENIWFVEREGDGWSEPHPVDATVNAFNHHWLFSISAAGTLYFSSVREGGFGERDIYRSRRINGAYEPPRNLGPVINTDGIEHTPFIAPDESYLIFASTKHGPHRGMFHFLISYRQPQGGWSPPQALDRVTAPVSDPLCPIITADGRFMFFIGSGDIWWVRANFIEDLRGK